MSERRLQRVTRRHPCPVCGKDHWCSVAEDGSFAICMREARGAAKRTVNGGWLHRLTDSPGPRRAHRPPPATPPAPRADFALLAEQLARAADCDRIAGWLGVSADALRALDTGYDQAKRAIAWPMRDDRMRIVGIRYRAAFGEARKWAERGSRSGLFVPRAPLREPLLICEGPTDAAAALSIGLSAIGRPANRGALDWIVGLVLRHGLGLVVLVPDRDRRATAGGHHTIAGARELAEALRARGVTVRDLRRVIQPGCDLRSWVRSGQIDRILRWAAAS